MLERKSISTTSDAETKALGKKFASVLRSGDVIGLYGDLGAGKTTFVKGLVKGFGMNKIVKSPTFTLMNIYPIKDKTIKQLVHIDCYRLTDPDQLEEIGALEYFGKKDTVVIIEWAEKVKRMLPDTLLKVHFKIKKGDAREVSF